MSDTIEKTPKTHSPEEFGDGSSTVRHAALLYALTITLLGFMLPLASFVAVKPFPRWALAGFYIGMYTCSAAFLIAFLGWIQRIPPRQVTVARESTTEGGSCTGGNGSNSTATEDAPASASQASLEIPSCAELPRHVESHAPSFFLRVACVIFGALKVTHEALMIVDTLMDVAGGCMSSASESAGQVTQYLMSICFTVLQTGFLMKHCKLSVNVCMSTCYIGFAHLLATNLCDWFLATLLETSHSAAKAAEKANAAAAATKATSSYSSPTPSYYNYTIAPVELANITSTASTTSALCSKDAYWRMAPYLLPFTIEYAMMSAASAYAMSQNIGKLAALARHQPSRCLASRVVAQSRLDCLRSGRGLLVGALLFTVGLASSIYFTICVNDKSIDSPVTSQLIYQITDLILLAANLTLSIAAFVKMRQLNRVHRQDESTGPDAWLLGITLIGVLAYQIFQLFGAVSDDSKVLLALRLAQGLLGIGQSVFQVFLIFEVEHRHCLTASLMRTKPGREAVAGLLLGNLALWIVYTLETREMAALPSYNQAYSPVATGIIAYVCSPLIIFFRFHSACCFVEIWRNCYKTSAPDEQGAVEHTPSPPMLNLEIN